MSIQLIIFEQIKLGHTYLDLLIMQVFKLTITLLLIINGLTMKAHELIILKADKTWRFDKVTPSMSLKFDGYTFDFIKDSLITGNESYNLYINKFVSENTFLPRYKNTLFLVYLYPEKPYFIVNQIDKNVLK